MNLMSGQQDSRNPADGRGVGDRGNGKTTGNGLEGILGIERK
jgi:hypothetical protein